MRKGHPHERPSLFRLVAPEWSAVSREALEDLSLLNHIALGLIAFTAGGELKISAIKERWKTFFSITLVQSTAAFVGVGGMLALMAPNLPGLSELSGPAIRPPAGAWNSTFRGCMSAYGGWPLRPPGK